jgi:hypothetical protein
MAYPICLLRDPLAANQRLRLLNVDGMSAVAARFAGASFPRSIVLNVAMNFTSRCIWFTALTYHSARHSYQEAL